MRAVLLAAGLGTRLGPLTKRLPKCLVPVGGTPVLGIWLQKLASAGVDEVLVNAHHHAPMVRDYLSSRPAGGPAVQLVEEAELLGSAGTLAANRPFLAGDEPFLAIYADNVTDADVGVLIDEHATHGPIATLGLFRTPRPEESGIVELLDGVVVSFEEKPAHPRSDLANAGLYVFSPEVLDEIPDGFPRDIGYDLLPRLVGRARGVELEDSFLVDIGTPERLAQAERQWTAGRSL